MVPVSADSVVIRPAVIAAQKTTPYMCLLEHRHACTWYPETSFAHAFMNFGAGLIFREDQDTIPLSHRLCATCEKKSVCCDPAVILSAYPLLDREISLPGFIHNAGSDTAKQKWLIC